MCGVSTELHRGCCVAGALAVAAIEQRAISAADSRRAVCGGAHTSVPRSIVGFGFGLGVDPHLGLNPSRLLFSSLRSPLCPTHSLLIYLIVCHSYAPLVQVLVQGRAEVVFTLRRCSGVWCRSPCACERVLVLLFFTYTYICASPSLPCQCSHLLRSPIIHKK